MYLYCNLSFFVSKIQCLFIIVKVDNNKFTKNGQQNFNEKQTLVF